MNNISFHLYARVKYILNGPEMINVYAGSDTVRKAKILCGVFNTTLYRQIDSINRRRRSEHTPKTEMRVAPGGKKILSV